jgi:hypothetical protein
MISVEFGLGIACLERFLYRIGYNVQHVVKDDETSERPPGVSRNLNFEPEQEG